MSQHSTLIRAARILAGERVLDGGGIVVVAGRVHSVLASNRDAREFATSAHESFDLGDALIAPAFVNAHAHLELSELAGSVTAAGTFSDWIRALIAARTRNGAEGLARGARTGARRLMATGTALVGDIDSSGAIESGAEGLALRVCRFREALDAGDATRAQSVLERVARPALARERFHEGLSPHAPYTVSTTLWSALGRLARERAWPVAIHFAETREEVEWLEHGEGPLAALLARSPRASGLDLIAGAGLLGERTLLIHGNHATTSERTRIAESGATLVHCPGTHRFFEREPFDARAWLDAGVPLALGTDSLASNTDLDMGRELALFAAAQPKLRPTELFACATSAGARALGFAGESGVIAPGAHADFALFRGGGGAGADVRAALVHGELACAALWLAGAPVGPEGVAVLQNAAPGSEVRGRGPK